MQTSEKTEVEREQGLAVLVEKLQTYYDDEILGTLVDLVQDNDEDEYYMKVHGEQIQGLNKLLKIGNSPKRQSNVENESPSRSSAMSLRRRRSGLRSNKKRLMNTANDALDSRKLKSIPEVIEDHPPARDVSSSEKQPKLHAKLLNDTILEEQESFGPKRDEDIDLDLPPSVENSHYNNMQMR